MSHCRSASGSAPRRRRHVAIGRRRCGRGDGAVRERRALLGEAVRHAGAARCRRSGCARRRSRRAAARTSPRNDGVGRLHERDAGRLVDVDDVATGGGDRVERPRPGRSKATTNSSAWAWVPLAETDAGPTGEAAVKSVGARSAVPAKRPAATERVIRMNPPGFLRETVPAADGSHRSRQLASADRIPTRHGIFDPSGHSVP